MVREYKKKAGTGYSDYNDPKTKEKMDAAIKAVQNGEMNPSQAAVAFGVKRTTLSDKVKNLHPNPVGHPTVYSVPTDLLSEMRYGNKDKVEKRGRGKKVSVAAGKSHTHWEREQSSESEDDQAAAGDGEGDQAGPSVPSLSDRLDAIINNLLINQEYPDDESSEDNTSDEEY